MLGCNSPACLPVAWSVRIRCPYILCHASHITTANASAVRLLSRAYSAAFAKPTACAKSDGFNMLSQVSREPLEEELLVPWVYYGILWYTGILVCRYTVHLDWILFQIQCLWMFLVRKASRMHQSTNLQLNSEYTNSLPVAMSPASMSLAACPPILLTEIAT